MRRLPTTAATIATLAGALLVAAGPGIAHQGAQGVVKERMEVMKDMAATMKSVAAGIKAGPAADGSAIAHDVRELAARAGALPSLFPAGSDHHPTKALPTVWQDRDSFRNLSEELAQRAEALAAAAAQGDRGDMALRFKAVGETCRACHTDFRAKDEE